jgi:hypothetical protein
MPGSPIVVFLPGFMGSQMQRSYPTQLPKDVWYSTLEFLANGPDNLQLDSTGLLPGPLAAGPLAASGPVDFNFYEGLVRQLMGDGWTVAVYPFDWRMATPVAAKQFASWLNSNYAGNTVYVVAHSQGGILARYAYPLWTPAAGQGSWARTVYLGTPHGGSHFAAAAMAGNFGDDSWTTLLGVSVANAAGILKSFNRWPEDIATRYLQVVASWRGLMDMFPSQYGPYQTLDPLVPSQWLLAAWNGVNSAVTQSALSAEQDVVGTLAQYLAEPRPPEVCVVGAGFKTPQSYKNLINLRSLANYNNTLSGDGTVTVERGTLPGVSTLTMNLTHGGLATDATILSRLSGLLHNGLPGPQSGPVPTPPPAASLPPVASTWEPVKPPVWKQVKNDP